MGSTAKRLKQPRRAEQEDPERDDSASEPYSDELLSDSASPELLVTSGAGDEVEGSLSGEDNISGEEEPSGLGSLVNERGDIGSMDEPDQVSSGTEDMDGTGVKARISKVSFGALAKARDALDAMGTADGSRRRKRGGNGDGDAEAEEKLRALRERLREIQAGKKIGERDMVSASTKKAKRDNITGDTKAKDYIALNGDSSASEQSGDESASSDESEESDRPTVPASRSRTSKHAPQIQSTKRAVTRKRTIIDLPKSTARDPRFDPITGPLDADKVNKQYSFLQDYQSTEIQALRKQLKDPKSARSLSDAQKDDIKRQILVLESKQRSARDKERTKEVVREHRRAEKEAVTQGKKPFYLKQSEVRKETLVKKFEGMKGKEREKVIERRRRKLAAREKKSMPGERRGL